MKNKLAFFINVLLLGFFLLSCTDHTKNEKPAELAKTIEEKEKEKVLKMAEEIAFREYGDVINNELPLNAKLVGDSVWVVEGTLPKDADGGTVYIEIKKSDKKVLKITHYK